MRSLHSFVCGGRGAAHGDAVTRDEVDSSVEAKEFVSRVVRGLNVVITI